MCNGFCSGFCSVFGRPLFHVLLTSSDLCGIFRLVFQRIVAHFSNEVFRALNVADRRSPVRRASWKDTPEFCWISVDTKAITGLLAIFFFISNSRPSEHDYSHSIWWQTYWVYEHAEHLIERLRSFLLRSRFQQKCAICSDDSAFSSFDLSACSYEVFGLLRPYPWKADLGSTRVALACRVGASANPPIDLLKIGFDDCVSRCAESFPDPELYRKEE